jgi:flagellar biosynthesis/type III secretory pathway chaperone
MHLQQTSEALVILTRQAEQHTLYGSNGQAAQVSGSRIVDSA